MTGSVQAIVLAGGEGARLRPLTADGPKVLLPIANRPILFYVLDAIVEAGIRDITVVVGYKSTQVINALSRYQFPVNIVIQKYQLGVTDAIRTAESQFRAERILFISGDNYINTGSIRKLLDEDKAMLVYPSDIPWEYGIIEQTMDGILTSIKYTQDEHHAPSLVSCAAFLYPRTLSELMIRSDEIYAVENCLRHQIKVIRAEVWEDAVSFPTLLKLNRHVLETILGSLAGTIDSSAVIRGKVTIGKNTQIGPNVVITGPVIIGENCSIDANSTIGPYTSISSNVEIEACTYISNSIIMQGSTIGAQSRIVDAVIGEGVEIAHTITVSVNSLGAVIGNHSSVGGGTCLKGTVIGNHVVVADGRTVTGVIPDNAVVM